MCTISAFTFSVLICDVVAAADSFCRIEVKDVNSSSSFQLDYEFNEDPDGLGQRRLFSLPGNGRQCILVWSDRNSGTSLTCELDELGETYVQSDRSLISEEDSKNFLLFSIGDAFFEVNVVCRGV
jgi:hypothetical protein